MKLFRRYATVIVAVLLFSASVFAQHHPRFDTIRERIESRDYPSLFAAWGGIGNPPVLDDVPGAANRFEEFAIYDVHWGSHFMWWTPTDNGFETSILHGHRSVPANWQRWVWRYNPNTIFLYPEDITAEAKDAFPPDSPYWLRDANGNRLDYGWGRYALDFGNPEVQELIIQEFVFAAQSGLYDGIFIDSWRCCDLTSFGYSHAEETAARTAIIAALRERVHPDFLIVVNTNRSRLEPEHVAYINGLFMETGWDRPGVPYTVLGLAQIEDTLTWATNNLREPVVNCLEGFGIPQVFDSPENLRLMRVFTTMSLTLDNGSMLYNKYDSGHSHNWYEFWNTNLGQPIGPKGNKLETDEGVRADVFWREFTNGWSVYNRSTSLQSVEFPVPIASVTTGTFDYIHEVPPVDGDLFLKSSPTSVSPRGKLTTMWGKIKRQW